jgi:hypothetical protein
MSFENKKKKNSPKPSVDFQAKHQKKRVENDKDSELPPSTHESDIYELDDPLEKDEFDELGPPPLPPGNDYETDAFLNEPPLIDKKPIGQNKNEDLGGPPDISLREYDLDYHEDRSYLFIFGPSSAGKTVMISSILYYLESSRSILFGDTLKNINNNNLKHEREGNKLWKELSTTLFENQFPKGTAKIKIENPFPRHINSHFIPASDELIDFKFCLMDMAGDDLHNIDPDSKLPLPESIKIYVEQMPKINICFLYILDPTSESYSKSEQLSIFKAFIDLLDQNQHTDTPLLFIVSKWDKVKNSYADIEEYIKEVYQPIWGILNQQARQISFAEFSIGEVNENNTLIKKYDPFYSEKVFNWFYKMQTDKSLISKTEKTKKGFFNKHFKK